MVDLSSIEQADVLRGLTREDLRELGAIAGERAFSRRDRLFRRGEEAETIYVVTRGRFVLTVALRVFDGYTELPVEQKGPLDALGWSSLVEPRTSIYSGYCMEDGAAITFPRRELEGLMAANPQLGSTFRRNLNELIGRRLRSLQELWLEEVSQSMGRVRHWTHTELTVQWHAAMKEADSRGSLLGWLRREPQGGSFS